MWRSLLLALGILAATYLEYEIYPGHTFLQGETQIYVPVLERLDSPGFLSRDLVATHPQVTYTIYDEATLLLHKALGWTFQRSLQVQQFLIRLAMLAGVYLLILSTGANRLVAIVLASVICLGAHLPGPAVAFPDPEPIPRDFCFGLLVLATGLLAREKPLLAGLAGGLAMAYSPSIASTFWIAVLLGYVVNRQLRVLFRPSVTVLFVFMLLLANLAQLQPGIAEAQPLFRSISHAWEHIQKSRSQSAWVSLWARSDIWHYLAIWVCGLWATTRVSGRLNRQTRWLVLLLPLLGVLSVPASWFFLEVLRWPLAAQVEPARALIYTVCFSTVACALAGLNALESNRLREAGAWFFVVAAEVLSNGLLNVLRVTESRSTLAICLAGVLSATLVFTIQRFLTRKHLWLLLTPVIAIMCAFLVAPTRALSPADSIEEVADWAERSTWGSSMFLFPDAQRAVYPGIFRARSKRALYVDWTGGEVSNGFESFALEWWKRWQETMTEPFPATRVQAMLRHPIDYYILKRENMLHTVRPVFATADYVIYDAQDLRNAPKGLE